LICSTEITDQTNQENFESVAEQHFQNFLGLGLSAKRCKTSNCSFITAECDRNHKGRYLMSLVIIEKS